MSRDGGGLLGGRRAGRRRGGGGSCRCRFLRLMGRKGWPAGRGFAGLVLRPRHTRFRLNGDVPSSAAGRRRSAWGGWRAAPGGIEAFAGAAEPASSPRGDGAPV